ncbi:GATOR complex protein WDR24-like [Vespa mandarinia]|uniref:GATOR complex protein WDR24-like n=1 Tax=Vespa mandarinia TaxID=7446 RepID=UPI0016151814|nr:GATOR complex protein WDR24-like [Vespa mandarinia]
MVKVLRIINSSRPSFKIVVPSTRTLRETQKDIFKDEQVALSSSEIEDLNLPYNETGSLNEKKKSFTDVPFDEKRPSEEEEDEFDKYVKVIDTKHVGNRSTFDPSFESKNEMLHNDHKVISNIDDESSSYVDSNRNGYSSNENIISFDISKEPKNKSKKEIVNYSPSVPIEKFVENNKSTIDYNLYNIPYVEVPDYTDEREESLDEEDRLRAKSQNSNSKNLSIDSIDRAMIIINTTSDQAYSVGKKNETIDKHGNQSLRSMATKNVKSFEISDPSKNDMINREKTKMNENNVQSSESKVKNKSSDDFALSNIDFDINEYRKPFDLDDFLKNEPFFHELKNNNNNKRNTNSDEEIRMENKRKDMEENKKRNLKTLSSILEKKDRISRFDEEVNKDIEDGVKKAPSFYKNYWSLEYKLPGMKDIKRDEENMN